MLGAFRLQFDLKMWSTFSQNTSYGLLQFFSIKQGKRARIAIRIARPSRIRTKYRNRSPSIPPATSVAQRRVGLAPRPAVGQVCGGSSAFSRFQFRQETLRRRAPATLRDFHLVTLTHRD